ncbi:hypothetical protein SAMN04487957_11099 [Halomonas shengliensis]|uniref:Uncharacterized protein n=1 Tax=Halomonas shengliensis TaxID=419597 RepID=A0A1H0LTP2_9GAMM|nr:hypothetical protein [Halomonas shengliensis]SDO71411.1 hypothetical protein SAMN04487957_11099 [Halomonas shengliensis]
MKGALIYLGLLALGVAYATWAAMDYVERHTGALTTTLEVLA